MNGLITFKASVRDADRLIHPLHSHILEVSSDKSCSMGTSIVEFGLRIWECQWLQYLISISLSIETAVMTSLASSNEKDGAPNCIKVFLMLVFQCTRC